mmetsp:Transcript_33139/g.83567  ORF Transcript_33139/g.83567 Transcript_33139/m.83567 type:complete len:288 (+) Transcript_33139:692-1555(+)
MCVSRLLSRYRNSSELSIPNSAGRFVRLFPLRYKNVSEVRAPISTGRLDSWFMPRNNFVNEPSAPIAAGTLVVLFPKMCNVVKASSPPTAAGTSTAPTPSILANSILTTRLALSLPEVLPSVTPSHVLTSLSAGQSFRSSGHSSHQIERMSSSDMEDGSACVETLSSAFSGAGSVESRISAARGAHIGSSTSGETTSSLTRPAVVYVAFSTSLEPESPRSGATYVGSRGFASRLRSRPVKSLHTKHSGHLAMQSPHVVMCPQSKRVSRGSIKHTMHIRTLSSPPPAS